MSANQKDPPQKDRHRSPFINSLSGMTASAISVTLCFPLEVMKTRMQIQGQMNTQKYSIGTIRNVIAEEGMRGLYRGYTISIVTIPMFHTLYFPIYERVKSEVEAKYHWDRHSMRLYSLSAGISGLICNVITNPLWVVRTRMQAESFRSLCDHHYQRTYQGMFQSMIKIAHEEGIRTLWNGLAASILGISHALIYFPLYERSKLYFKERFQPEAQSLSSMYIGLSSIGSKIISSALTYPHEVIRSRQQDSRKSENTSSKFSSVIKSIIQNEGYQAFYSGFRANLFRILPHYCFVFVFYEKFAELFSKAL